MRKRYIHSISVKRRVRNRFAHKIQSSSKHNEANNNDDENYENDGEDYDNENYEDNDNRNDEYNDNGNDEDNDNGNYGDDNRNDEDNDNVNYEGDDNENYEGDNNENYEDIDECIIDEALKQNELPNNNGNFWPYFESITAALLFCWHSQFCINDIITNIRRFRKWRHRLPLISIRSCCVKISTKKTPSTTCTSKPAYYLSVSDIIWYVLNNRESPQFGQETIVINHVSYQIGDYVYYKEANRKKIGRILAIILENNIKKLKIQRVLIFDELPEGFHTIIRQQQFRDGALWLLDRNEYNAIILLEPQAIIQKITKSRSVLLDYKHPSEYAAIQYHDNSLPVYKFFLDLYYNDFGTYRNIYHSLGGVYLQFGNMIFNDRKQLKNHFVLRFVPFRGDFDDFIKPFIKEIQQLEKGKVFEINEIRCLIIVSLGQVTADLLQGNDLALTDQQKFATEYGLRNKRSILDLLIRERHLQTPQDVYHLTAGKIQRLLNLTVNLLSNDVWHHESFMMSDCLRLGTVMPFIINRFLCSNYIKNNSLTTIQNRCNITRADFATKMIVTCWKVVAETMVLVFKKTYNNDDYILLQKCLKKEMEILSQVFEDFALYHIQIEKILN
ncbi:hypothetical protein C1646_767448 [Rhizophagus diaphanus]|nr:hypothetical protein C1646_767448 [Rhizophagus diaphanus] [Rhizophagus sp. MUCL 43196]